MAYDMQAAVTSWVAQELEAQVPGEDIGYWVTLERPGGDTHGTLYLQAPEHQQTRRLRAPFEEDHVRQSTRFALGALARDYTERDR
jgi:hypothetical protein